MEARIYDLEKPEIYDFEGNVLDLMQALFDTLESSAYVIEEKKNIEYAFDFRYHDVLEDVQRGTFSISQNHIRKSVFELYKLGIPIIVVKILHEYNAIDLYPVGYDTYFLRFKKFVNRLAISRYIESDVTIFVIEYELCHIDKDSLIEVASLELTEDELRKLYSLDDLFKKLKDSDVITL